MEDWFEVQIAQGRIDNGGLGISGNAPIMDSGALQDAPDDFPCGTYLRSAVSGIPQPHTDAGPRRVYQTCVKAWRIIIDTWHHLASI